MAVQPTLLVPRGRRRPGGGRKPSPESGVPHLRRPPLAARHPVHVSTRLGQVRVLRRKDTYRVVRDALAAGADRFGMRVVQFSVQANHLHLICEASDRRALSRGLQGLLIRIARGINRHLGRSGKVFADRYHEHLLRTPMEVRAALVYVLQNSSHHSPWRRHRQGEWWLDPCSSVRRFYGLDELDPEGGYLEERWLPEARTWLLRVGWRRAGPIHPEDRPADSGRR